MNFCCGVWQLFELPRCKEGHQTALYCLELFGRSKCLVTGLDASLSFLFYVVKLFSESSSFVFLSRRYTTFCNKSKLNDIGGDTGEVISNLNGSLGSRYFLDFMNERTSFASCARAFKDPC